MSVNLITQIVSAILLIFNFSGLAVDPIGLAAEIVQVFKTGNVTAIFTLFVINLGNIFYHWIKTLRENPKAFLGFWRSTNFWTSIVNIFFPAGGVMGAIGGILTNIINIVFHRLVPNPAKVLQSIQVGARYSDPTTGVPMEWNGSEWVVLPPNTEAKAEKLGGE